MSLYVRFAYFWVCLPTFPHELCKACWTAGGDGQPLDVQTHKQIQEAEALTFDTNVRSDHLKCTNKPTENHLKVSNL